VRDGDAALGHQVDLGVIQPYAMREQGLLGLQQAQFLKSRDWALAVAARHLGNFDIRLVRMGVKSGAPFIRECDGTPMCRGSCVKRVLNADPDAHAAIGLAVP
jgi:hypothetical protein